MYESFFGQNEKPFNLTPDPRYFYLSESHREALAGLIYGVREKAGLITLTGPAGVGKTMILASFLDQIREYAVTASFSGVVSGNRIEFLKDLCSVLGITPEQESLFGVSQAIKDFAIQKAGAGRAVVVLVDEAQDLGLEALEHFHHLCNLETPEAKLVQVVLAGTQKLDDKLKDKSLEALWQRAAIRCAIKPIGPEETIAYIFHRMRVAGSSSSELFSDDALRRIVNTARGVPRLINLVCNQAMISAYSSGRLPVDEDAVLEALRELDGGHSGDGTEETIVRRAIRGMVEIVFRRQEEGAAPEEERATIPRRPRWDFSSRFGSGRRFPLTLVPTILLAMVGAVMAIGLLKAKDDVVERVDVGFLEGADARLGGDSPQKSSLGYRIPRGGPEQPVGEKDVAQIALEHYGRLDVGMLKVLREKNPQIRDWNRLTRNVQLLLPDMPEPTNGGVDFYTIQVGAFQKDEGISRMASEMTARGAQNLFFVKGGSEKKFTFVCVGVFESERQSLGSVRVMQEWGYKDAFPFRVRAKRLEDILPPYAGSGTLETTGEKLCAEAEGFPPSRE